MCFNRFIANTAGVITSKAFIMGLFWRRKSGDEFVRLGLNEPVARKESDTAPLATQPEKPIDAPELVPSTSGGGPTPTPSPSNQNQSSRVCVRSHSVNRHLPFRERPCLRDSVCHVGPGPESFDRRAASPGGSSRTGIIS